MSAIRVEDEGRASVLFLEMMLKMLISSNFAIALKALQDKIKADGPTSTDMLAWRALHCRIDHRRSYFSTIAMLRPLGECLKPETKDKHGSVVDTTACARPCCSAAAEGKISDD